MNLSGNMINNGLIKVLDSIKVALKKEQLVKKNKKNIYIFIKYLMQDIVLVEVNHKFHLKL